MIYTALTNRAMRIAYEAHAGQVDKCGMPYVFHPYHLAEQMPDEVTTCVALLHDVVEDTAITLDELEREFPPEVTEPLRLLTHDPAVPYRDYIDALVVDPVARTVKRADLVHNLDETRFEGCGHIDEAKLSRRRERYRVALEVLDEGEQFSLMLEHRSAVAERVLYEVDPMGLCVGEEGAPIDEYAFEALILAACVSPEMPVSEAERIVGLVLGATFDMEIGASERESLARRLLDAWPEDRGLMDGTPEEIIDMAIEDYRGLQEQWEREAPAVTLPDGSIVKSGVTVHALVRMALNGAASSTPDFHPEPIDVECSVDVDWWLKPSA